ncbi:MAG: molybdopterin-dependent oxidoreductase [Candidatus Omnitrophica bacterium]|nr:molybdopterin-dependent oxidoreductase [Candidatus Omnitrophota bacterium]
MKMTRRQFLKAGSAAGVGAWLTLNGLHLWALEPVDDIENPLAYYPNRDWEKIYRDQYRYDSTFSWVCSPNDTHACRAMAYVRNGIVFRLGSEYNYQTYQDLYGNHATPNWNPRQCAKGYTFHRLLYGPYRLKHPIVRRGWRQWADDGFPELTEVNKSKYKFDSRGTDKLEKISWDDVYTYIGKALISISKRYSGEDGKQKLLAQGYPPEMVDAMQGAGTRTVKMRGGMGLLGVFGKYGMYRLCNTLAILDTHVRDVKEKDAKAGRTWSNYTWHGDQAPGHPWVHGLQNSDCDFNDLRSSKLIIQDGKNLVENKMTDSHWFIECMERGAKLVTISPEYSPPATKSDYWIPIRPQTDAALFLGITRLMIDKGWYDKEFVNNFTDFPLLVRTDNLKRLRAAEIFPDYQLGLSKNGPSFKYQGLNQKQYEQLGDYVVWDADKNQPAAITRDDVGAVFAAKVKNPALEGTYTLQTIDGKEIEVMTLFSLYKIHLKDYDLDNVVEITHAPKDLIIQLAKDIATIKPAALHQGEGINHWFHATEMNRAGYLPFMLTGNIGKKGAGVHGWAGNYKAALFQGSPWTGPGFKGWVAEDPFHPNLDPQANGRDIKAKALFKDEEPAYWNHGDRPLIVETPKEGRKVFTGDSHMPTPSKAIIFNNVNLINNAKHCYDMIKNVNPNVEMIVSFDIQMTASIEYADIALPANSWLEFEGLEVTASCSNPFLQIWKGGIPPVFDSRDDLNILSQIAQKLGDLTGDKRFSDYWKFALENNREVYIQRLLDSSTTTTGYQLKDIMAGKFGPPGGALMLFRTYPRIPFWEQVHESQPFYTDTGRMHAYTDVPEAIDYGENFIVHREGPEATPYLPNVIVSSNPYIRPNDYGISLNEEHWDKRTIRNVKLSWEDTKKSKNFLWEKGFKFFCLTPKSRHRVHSLWSNVDWHQIWDSNFGDPYRMDKRTPGVGEQQIHMNPEAAKDLGFNDGDYVYVDANPADRPYVGAKPDDPFYKVARLMLRVKYNSAYPYNVVMMKHGTYIATDKSVKAHETRPDKRALSEGGAYQANFRYGSQQSVTRNWHMPMHQTDTLFHKRKVFMSFMFGGEADNHAVNTVPKETLVRLTKAEDGGMNGKGIWKPATSGYSPANENSVMKKYLEGGFVSEKDESEDFWGF